MKCDCDYCGNRTKLSNKKYCQKCFEDAYEEGYNLEDDEE